MITIDIRTNVSSAAAKLNQLQKDLGNRATASAINKTVDLGRTQMIRGITDEFNVKAAYVRERLRVRRASAKQGRFSIEGSLIGGKAGAKRSANLIAFVERSVTLAEARRRRKAGTLNQVFVKVKRKGPRKAVKGAFIGNKGRTLFKRVGKDRLPIKPVQVIDVAQMFNTKRVNQRVRAVMQARFADVFEREARFYLNRFNRGGR